MIVRHVVIRGRVQAVGFRAFVEDAAEERYLEGWVRNRPDGSVEAVFAGREEAADDQGLPHRGARRPWRGS